MEHKSEDWASLLAQLPKEFWELREEVEHESEDCASLLAQLPEEFWELREEVKQKSQAIQFLSAKLDAQLDELRARSNKVPLLPEPWGIWGPVAGGREKQEQAVRSGPDKSKYVTEVFQLLGRKALSSGTRSARSALRWRTRPRASRRRRRECVAAPTRTFT